MLGVVLLAIYVVVYAGYIVVCGFNHSLAASSAPGGVNVAVAYGFGLIVFALVLAIIYLMKVKD